MCIYLFPRPLLPTLPHIGVHPVAAQNLEFSLNRSQKGFLIKPGVITESLPGRDKFQGRKKFEKEAVQRVLDKFTIPQCIAEYRNLYNEMIDANEQKKQDKLQAQEVIVQ